MKREIQRITVKIISIIEEIIRLSLGTSAVIRLDVLQINTF